jgi:hypothetical protein
MQSAPDHVGEWQERLGPGGIWEQGEGDAGGTIASGVDGGLTSPAVRVGAAAASTAEKAGTSTAPPIGGEQDDLCMTDPWPTPDPQTAGAWGALTEDDAHRCLYVSTPWEEEVTADHRDIDDFKEASCTIERVLSVRIPVGVIQIMFLSLGVLQGLISSLFAHVVVTCQAGVGSGRSAARGGQWPRRGRRSPRGYAARPDRSRTGDLACERDYGASGAEGGSRPKEEAGGR